MGATNGDPGFLTEPGNARALVPANTTRPGDEAAMLRAAVHGLAEHPVRVVLTAPKGGITDDVTAAASVVGHLPHSLILQ